MVRAYTVSVAALALDVDPKWIDNVLSHHAVRGVERRRQGIQRRIPADSLLILATARSLIDALSIPISRALHIAERLHEATSETAVSDEIAIAADMMLIARRLNERLADAIEGAAQRPRGRPSR